MTNKRESNERLQAGKADLYRTAVANPRAIKKLCKNHKRERLSSRLREQYPRSGSASVSEHEGRSMSMSAHVSPDLKQTINAALALDRRRETVIVRM